MFTYILVMVAVLLRLFPHMPNFVPIIAIAMYAGAYLPKKQALFLPLLIMVISDLIIGLHDVVFFTWSAMLLCGVIGTRLHDNVKPGTVLSTTLFAAVAFFLVSNFGVWIAWYPHTFAGLTDCFVKAIPFFRSTFLVNTAVVIVMFSLHEVLKKVSEKYSFKKALVKL
ncbi:MAG: hypothetical protein PHQ52_06875 [Candidatus Omnitrophica bacterium]|nr:hypothetical protein [Candidatus Omnitrophota bacterium]